VYDLAWGCWYALISQKKCNIRAQKYSQDFLPLRASREKSMYSSTTFINTLILHFFLQCERYVGFGNEHMRLDCTL
jgi:hypothetical protein